MAAGVDASAAIDDVQITLLKRTPDVAAAIPHLQEKHETRVPVSMSKTIDICSPDHAPTEEELALLVGVYLLVVKKNAVVDVGVKFGSNMFAGRHAVDGVRKRRAKRLTYPVDFLYTLEKGSNS